MFGGFKNSKEGKAWDIKQSQASSNKHPLNYGGSGNRSFKGGGIFPANREKSENAANV